MEWNKKARSLFTAGAIRFRFGWQMRRIGRTWCRGDPKMILRLAPLGVVKRAKAASRRYPAAHATILCDGYSRNQPRT